MAPDALGAIAVDHVALTVADVDRSAAFYGLLGFAPGRRYQVAGEATAEGTGCPGADLDILLLDHATGGPRLELIRYRNRPAGRAAQVSEVGAAHVCLAVADVHAAVAILAEAGVELVSLPHRDGDVVWVYLRDPDGNAVELLERGR